MAVNPYDTPTHKLRARIETTRRQFLLLAGAIGALGTTIFGGLELIKFMFPAATLEAPPDFKFNPAGMTPGQVKQITDKRVTVVLDNQGFYAVYLVCTHLGCTPNYNTSVLQGSGVSDEGAHAPKDVSGFATSGWACPCHGSRYYIDSTNFYGPAPRPMDWVEVSWTPDNQLLIDRSKLVVYRQPGQTTVPQWRLPNQPGAKSNGKTLGV